jgi:biopolymer transport protein ExbD
MIRHRRGDDGGLGVNLGLIITPFLDFSFQLLFLFVCLYQPSALEGQIQMRLPMPAEAKGKAEVPNMGEDPQFEAEVTIVVKTEQDGLHAGTISQLTIVRDGKTTEITDKTGRVSTDPRDLLQELKKVREDLTNQDDIKLQGDKKLKWAYMIQVIDACRHAGFKNPAFQAPPDEGM